MSQDTDQQLKNLEKKVDLLVDLCEQLKIENRSLKAKQNDLVRDRARLLEKTALARSRVEAMITRLKSMGQGT
ncbi:MAG: TIGR02449 family protein [Methylococcaceae bacterium]|nr:TIGR02449 family protein [Methylococcaceae bacterium]MCI0732503.1 TIGR02449 family protein [Methylococcaceae bacterium]